MTTRKIIGYRLEPVYEPQPGDLATAAFMTCIMTDEVLSGMGGGGDFLAPAAVDFIRDARKAGEFVSMVRHKRSIA